MKNISFSEGVHFLSGFDTVEINIDNWDCDMVEAVCFIIDGKTYVAYTDPDDGYRSYGFITESNVICKNTFEPQKVVIENVRRHREEEGMCLDDYYGVIIKDAILNLPVIKVGTNYADDYYPIGNFEFNPMNLYINVERSIRG